jgi:hypothetical protein
VRAGGDQRGAAMADKEGNLDAVLKEAVDLVTTGFLLRRFLDRSGMSGQGCLWAYLYSWISGSTGGFISWFLLSLWILGCWGL